MKKNKKEKTIKSEIISKLEKDEIKMKSKTHFILKASLISALAILFLLISLYLTLLVVFVFESNEIWTVSGTGLRGLKIAVVSFPWYLIVLILAIIIFIQTIAKEFSIVYRRPLIYSLIATMLVILLGTVLTESMSLHKSFSDYAKKEEVPVFRGIYRHLENIDMENVFFGKITKEINDDWKIILQDGERLSLQVTKYTKGVHRMEEMKEGGNIVVIGEKQGKIIKVESFRKMRNQRQNHRNEI